MSHIGTALFTVLFIGLTAAVPSPDLKSQSSSKSSDRIDGSKYNKEDLLNPFCGSFEFTCDNGNCIPSTWECDNENDCKDNSDEHHCILKTDDCATDEFQCSDGTCVPDSWKCDGVNDCDSGEDESNCTTSSHNCNNSDDSSCTDDNTANGIVDVHLHFNDGCFPPKAIVSTVNGSVAMENLEVGTMILAVNQHGRLTYSPVITFLDKDTEFESKYTTIETEDGTVLTLTRSHLIYRASKDNHTQLQIPNDILPVFASKIKVNDYIFTLSKGHNKQVRPSKVVKVTNMKITGNYAPLTLEGTLVVNGVLTSCYAVIDDHRMAHTAFAPLRLLYHSMPSLLSEKMGDTLLSWYPKLLETVGSMVLDEKQYHHSTVKHIVREG